MGDHVEIVEAERPATQQDENAYFARVFREALERIADELNLPGSPSLLTTVPDAAIQAIRENRIARRWR